MLRIYQHIYQYQENGSMPCFSKSYRPISHLFPQDDFAVVMNQSIPDENPRDLNCHI